MAFFAKNSNETVYVGGKKHWADVIKNSGQGQLLIWRQPEEDFNTNSTLIVMPGEEAIFIKGGTVERVFESGTYHLSTENYPFISRLRNAFTGGISTFNCVVYFVRKAHSTEILWGTTSPIQVRDKLLGIATRLRARGAYKIQVDNSVMFLEKLLGNNIPYQRQADLNKYFINEFQSKIRSVIARGIQESETELLGIDARLDELSAAIEPYIDEMVAQYGLRCRSFSIAAIDIDDDELRRKYDEIGMEAIAKMRTAQAEQAAFDILGDNWGKLQSAAILKDIAKNPGSGGIAATGAALGMGLGAGGAFGTMAQQMVAPTGNPFPTPQEKKYEQTTSDPLEVLTKLKNMLDAGLIEQSEYDAKKAEILNRM
ncbi:MAG: SPFH domain-containing protein [Clostridiales bacterium]|nr:SPFH domain-containing protein [Clostridiales bacterium]